MNIYRDEQTTGIHAGWDVGTDTGATAMTDVVNEETPVEEGLDMCRTQRIPCREMKRRRKAQTRRRIAENTPQDNEDEPQDSGTRRRITEISPGWWNTPQDNGQ